SVTAAGALDVTSPALVSVTGPAAGATIALRAPDLAIAAGGRLGQRGLTGSIVLINTAPGAGTYLGGAGQAGAWSLDAAEAARVFADGSLTIAPAANAAVAPAP